MSMATKNKQATANSLPSSPRHPSSPPTKSVPPSPPSTPVTLTEKGKNRGALASLDSPTESPPPSPNSKALSPRTPTESPLPQSITRNNSFRSNVSDRLRSHSKSKSRSRKRRLERHPPEARERSPKQDRSQTAHAAHGPRQYDEQVLGRDEFDLQFLERAMEELYLLPKVGKSYRAIRVNEKRIEKRLKHLSKNTAGMECTPDGIISQGREIADLVSLLMIEESSSKLLGKAGHKAQRAATLMLQANMMSEKARELFAQSLDLLQAAGQESD